MNKQDANPQPQGSTRAKPGTKGEGNFYHVIIRPKESFTEFRVQDIGKRGHIERLAGHRQDGTWDTQAWLISKQDAHVEGNRLIPDTDDAREVLAQIGKEPVHVRGDIFDAQVAGAAL